MVRGIYTVQRKGGTAVYISYVPQGRAQLREKVELVPAGKDSAARVREAKARARDVLIKRRAAIVEGTFDLPRSRRVSTFAKFVEQHYAEELQERRLRTAEVEIHRLKAGALGRYFGRMLLTELDEWKVRGFIKARREGKLGEAVGADAINRDLARLSNLWNFAARRKLVTWLNPVREAGRLREPKDRVRYLTPDEEQRLLAQCRPALRALVEVALHTGIRRGALLGLRWRDVDFASSTVTVPEDLSKSRDPYHVAMNTRVLEVLRSLRPAGLASPEAFIFGKRDGSQRRSVRNAFAAACSRAKLEAFRFHDLRHTSASRIVQNGGTLFDAAQHLGHRMLAMMQRYAHLSPERRCSVAALTLALPPQATANGESGRMR